LKSKFLKVLQTDNGQHALNELVGHKRLDIKDQKTHLSLITAIKIFCFCQERFAGFRDTHYKIKAFLCLLKRHIIVLDLIGAAWMISVTYKAE